MIATASFLGPSLYLITLLDPAETSQKVQGPCFKEAECFPMLQTKDVLNFLTAIMYQTKMSYLSRNIKTAFCPLVIISTETKESLNYGSSQHHIA